MEININSRWFEKIQKGQKKVEGRLNKGKFANMKKGDIFFFVSKSDKLKVQVKNIYKYKSFHEYLEMEGLRRTLPGVSSIEKGKEIYYEFYSLEMEKEFGILAIEVKKI